MPEASSVRNAWARSSRSLNSTAPASTWSAGSASGATIFQRSFSRASVTAPFGPLSSTWETLSRSTSTTTLLRSTAAFFGTAVHVSSGIRTTLDSPARIA